MVLWSLTAQLSSHAMPARLRARRKKIIPNTSGDLLSALQKNAKADEDF